MGKHEVTWDEYKLYAFGLDRRAVKFPVAERIRKAADAVSFPSEKPYIEMSFGMGTRNYPAICMTPNAASLYCMWLSALTGEFYRLPTEAEWEYACRAGTTTAFAFGDDATKLDEYGWYEANSPENGDWRYHQVGTKKPNRWGLHDMHGNVAEWCLDQYVTNYNQFAKSVSVAPVVWPTKRYPRVLRGGAFDFEAAEARSAARMSGKLEWHDQEPIIPKNRWWLPSAKFVGFRIVRPLKVPSAQEMQRYWLSGMED
jgi:formylglycine-generating enzyme required for sulfatase activity